MPGLGLPTPSPEVAHARARVAAFKQNNKPPELIEAAERDLRAAKLAEHVRRIVDEAPPLTSDQRAHIASLLRPKAGAA